MLLVLILTGMAHANGLKTLEPVGPHYPILSFEKNENPQNIMVIYAKTDKNCHFVPAQGKSILDFYWLMNRKDFKPVHPLIKSGIRRQLEIEEVGQDEGETFYIRINDLKRLKSDLPDTRIKVQARHTDQGCKVETLFTLGESDHARVLRLTAIAVESAKTFFPPFRKVVSVTLEGHDVASGAAVKRTFHR
jgi:hypothetical protein